MKYLPRPVGVGIAFEFVLVGLFVLCPVGPCAFSFVGLSVLYLHYPALLISLHLLHLQPDVAQFIATPILTGGIWILILFGVRKLFAKRLPKQPNGTALCL